MVRHCAIRHYVDVRGLLTYSSVNMLAVGGGGLVNEVHSHTGKDRPNVMYYKSHKLFGKRYQKMETHDKHISVLHWSSFKYMSVIYSFDFYRTPVLD
jgi:hypothetical protein